MVLRGEGKCDSTPSCSETTSLTFKGSNRLRLYSKGRGKKVEEEIAPHQLLQKNAAYWFWPGWLTTGLWACAGVLSLTKSLRAVASLCIIPVTGAGASEMRHWVNGCKIVKGYTFDVGTQTCKGKSTIGWRWSSLSTAWRMDGWNFLKAPSCREWKGWQRNLQIAGSRMANRINSLAPSAQLITG